MICGPRIHSSPSWPWADVVAGRPDVDDPHLGVRDDRPAEPGFHGALRVGLRWVTGLASVMP